MSAALSLPAPTLKHYLAWQLLEQAGAYLGGDVYAEWFDFENRTLSGVQMPSPRWKECVGTVSREMGERTLHEVYLKPFARAIQGGMTGIMCAMNALNGSWTCSKAFT